MSTEKSALELTPEQVSWQLDDSNLRFDKTDELEPLDEILGQPRAMKALDLGLGIENPTYNIYVAGLNGTGKKETIQRVLRDRVDGKKVPSDWVYLNNFEHENCPIAVDLDPGKGCKLQEDMNNLLRKLGEELPKAFQQEDFSREKQRIGRKYQERNQEAIQELEDRAREKGMTVQQTPQGQVNIVPLKDDGEPMSREEFEELSEEEREELNKRQREVAEQMDSLMSRGQQMKRELGEEVREVERNFAADLIDPHLNEIREKYEKPRLKEWFDNVREHMLNHLDTFRQPQGGQEQMLARALGGGQQGQEQQLNRYRVNVIVDNSKLEHAPVIIEDVPNYKNLFGTTGGNVDRFGRMSSDFSHIRAGSLLQANGGYLVLNLMDALIEPLVWKELKRSIKSGKVEFHAYDPLGVISAMDIRPEPIPLQVKLVVLGSPLIYHLLHLYDEDFAEIFKVKADFSSDMDIAEETAAQLGQFVRKIVSQENLRPFSAQAVAELMRTAVRMADNKKKVTAEFSRVADVIREACYWAREDNADTVQAQHVRRVTEERIYRSNLVEEKIRELIRDEVLLVDTEGEAIGQVNGLAVINLGDYMFGKPSRLTASVGVGSAGVINIERESKLSGHTFDKAMLILDGYLRNTYASEHPLALSAGIAMEQSYGMIDGDSASVAELLVLLSALAGVPLRQDIAITGSVNQWGQVQAIGGVNQKIEGFFDVCRVKGQKDSQGVCIPAANQRNLILRPDVVEAISKGSFHVWTISHVNEAIQLLTGHEPGSPSEEESFHGKVDKRFREMLAAIKEQKGSLEGASTPTVEQPGTARPDPRPPLPGDQ